MNERIRKIRKDFNLSQNKFGEKIGVAPNTVTNYETNRRTPSDAVILCICREFNVNENWLRTGTGDPYISITENDLIKKATILLSKKDPVFESFIEIYSKLTPENKQLIIKIGLDFFDTLKEKLDLLKE